MGYIKHDAVIVTISASAPALPDVTGFVMSMPEELRGLVIGPFPAVINGYVTYVFLPDAARKGGRAPSSPISGGNGSSACSTSPTTTGRPRST